MRQAVLSVRYELTMRVLQLNVRIMELAVCGMSVVVYRTLLLNYSLCFVLRDTW
jgi:hypothetical protein